MRLLALAGLKPGDRVLVNKTAYWFVGPRRGDIVAIHPPAEAIQMEPELKDQELVKRVIGLGGDIVEKINKIKQTQGPDLHVYGSANLASTAAWG